MKKILTTILIVAIMISIIMFSISLILSPIFGNVILKCVYYFEAYDYLKEKYDFKIKICSIEYDAKSSEYYARAKVPSYGDVSFKVYISNVNGIKISDDFPEMKWSADIYDYIKNDILAVYHQAEIRAGISRNGNNIYKYSKHIKEIPNYFDVRDYVGGDISVTILLNTDYNISDLNSAYKIYLTTYDMVKPANYAAYYNNVTFMLPYNCKKIGNMSEFSKFVS